MRHFSIRDRALISMVAGVSSLMSLLTPIPGWAFLSEAPQVPLVGKDSDGRSQVVYVPAEQYMEKMTSTLLEVDQSVLAQLNERTCAKESHDHFELTSVSVGIGIEFQVGLGALFSVTAGGKMELIYANQYDPVIQH